MISCRTCSRNTARCRMHLQRITTVKRVRGNICGAMACMSIHTTVQSCRGRKRLRRWSGNEFLTGNRNQKTDISEKPRQQSRQRDSMTSCKSAENSLQSRKARSRCILSRFRERERPADGGRQRKASQGCRSSPEGVTSSAGKRNHFYSCYMVLEMEEQDR